MLCITNINSKLCIILKLHDVKQLRKEIDNQDWLNKTKTAQTQVQTVVLS